MPRPHGRGLFLPMEHSPLFWPAAIAAALVVGFSKTGVPGVGIFAVALFALVIPTGRVATGLVLPLLICGDIVAVWSYHRHAQWKLLWRLFPWAATGIVIGFLTMKVLADGALNRIIGVILVLMVGLHLWRKYRIKDEQIPHGMAFSGAMGLSAGFTTQLANAAGPIMTIYLLAMQLPKMEFIGTGAWYFFILNSFKVPFMWNTGIINKGSLLINLKLAPFVFIGAFGGKLLLPRVNQRAFETIALVFAVVAGLKLIIF